MLVMGAVATRMEGKAQMVRIIHLMKGLKMTVERQACFQVSAITLKQAEPISIKIRIYLYLITYSNLLLCPCQQLVLCKRFSSVINDFNIIIALRYKLIHSKSFTLSSHIPNIHDLC